MTRTLSISRFRNFGIMAHIDAGKTTLSERVLFFSGRTHRIGNVDTGNTVLDDTDISIRRKITIVAAACSTSWTTREGAFADQKHQLNLIDTPGHVDFTIEVERSLRVLDGAVAVFDASQGVEPQSEMVWRQADRYRVPRLAFINKLDKIGADFTMSVASLRERLGARAVPTQLPWGEGADHAGIIDLVRMRAFDFRDQAEAGAYATVPIPGHLAEAAALARMELVEACADFDAAVMSHFVEGRGVDVTGDELERALRRGTLALGLVPVLCGSAFRSRGVQMLLDAVIGYLPSPADREAQVGRDPKTGAVVRFSADDGAPACALAFKLVSEPGAAAVTFLRVYSGVIRPGQALRVARTGRDERLGRLVRLYASQHEELGEACAGDIVGAFGLREVRTGDTLTDLRMSAALEELRVPEPVLEVAVHPRSNTDQDKLAGALRKLTLEDPSLRVRGDAESGETRLAGMGELHLEVAVEKLKIDHGVEVATGKPAVAYRETLLGAGRATYRHVKQDGGPGQFAVVTLEARALERGQGFRFIDATRGGTVPAEYIPSVAKGVEGSLERGLLAGYPMVDVEVRLLDGQTHVRDSSGHAFEVAGSLCFQQIAREVGVQLLEPVMAVEVVSPAENLGSVIGDLGSRRGQVLGMEERGGNQVVRAMAPLAELFGYVGTLRGLSHGRASAMLAPAHYAAVPSEVQARVGQEASR